MPTTVASLAARVARPAIPPGRRHGFPQTGAHRRALPETPAGMAFFAQALAAALALGISAAADTAQDIIPSPSPPERSRPAISLLPKGSTMDGVVIPRYDKQLRLASMLRARKMLILDASTIKGDDVSIETYRPDGRRIGRIELGQATYRQNPGVLTAKQRVEIESDDIFARGSGAVVHLDAARGFLLGPVESRIHAPAEKKKTTMTTPPAHPPAPHGAPPARPLRRRIAPTAALIAAMPVSLLASPAPLTEAQISAIDAAAAPTAGEADSRDSATRTLATAIDASSASAAASLDSFLETAGLATIAAETKARAAKPATPAPKTGARPPKPLPEPPPVKPTPQDTVITCDGGMFFDGEIGVLVYLENIRLSNPQIDLSCSDQLKIFLEKRPEKPKPKPKPAAKPDEKTSAKPANPAAATPPAPAKPALKKAPPVKKAAEAALQTADGLFSSKHFGDVRQIVATGHVLIAQKNAKGAPILAAAETAIFDGKTGDVILRGGRPKFQQGRSAVQAQADGQYIRIYKNGDVFLPGKWKTILGDLKNMPGIKKKK